MKPSVHDCKLIDLPKMSERKGAITPIYGKEHLPFEIKRIFYLYDVAGGRRDGAHTPTKPCISSSLQQWGLLR